MKMYEKDNMLYFTREGEIVRLSACGKDSLRFQASPNCTISEQDFTLMPQNTTAEITISENQASIQNGALRADIYGNGRVEYFYRGQKILREKSELTFDSGIRNYINNCGQLWRARVTFEANQGEHFYGLGHEATDCFDLKGCTIDLRHENAKCTIP